MKGSLGLQRGVEAVTNIIESLMTHYVTIIESLLELVNERSVRLTFYEVEISTCILSNTEVTFS
jgi:hypothetical protein